MDTYENLKFCWSNFPPLSVGLPGTGGEIRLELDDFKVEELPRYLPLGKGSHVYVWLEKRGLTTRDLILTLREAGVPEKNIGVAGLKDKHAVTCQWLSIPKRYEQCLALLDNLEGVRILDVSRHKNKLGMGHLSGNRFKVRIRNPKPNAVHFAEEIRSFLLTQGLPNYYGPQRFGLDGQNASYGFAYLKGGKVPGGRYAKRFFISSLQSLLFNHMLAERIKLGLFGHVVLGDWAKKHDTGGVFLVEDSSENERAKRFEISATLPLFGKKVKRSGQQAGELEQLSLNAYQLTWLDFVRRRGDRRFSRIALDDIDIQISASSYTLTFTLPKGCYATNILREFTKTPIDQVRPYPVQAERK